MSTHRWVAGTGGKPYGSMASARDLEQIHRELPRATQAIYTTDPIAAAITTTALPTQTTVEDTSSSTKPSGSAWYPGRAPSHPSQPRRTGTASAANPNRSLLRQPLVTSSFCSQRLAHQLRAGVAVPRYCSSDASQMQPTSTESSIDRQLHARVGWRETHGSPYPRSGSRYTTSKRSITIGVFSVGSRPIRSHAVTMQCQ